jgi:hypothetical protein
MEMTFFVPIFGFFLFISGQSAILMRTLQAGAYICIYQKNALARFCFLTSTRVQFICRHGGCKVDPIVGQSIKTIFQKVSVLGQRKARGDNRKLYDRNHSHHTLYSYSKDMNTTGGKVKDSQ